jgi:hypothetical protein
VHTLAFILEVNFIFHMRPYSILYTSLHIYQVTQIHSYTSFPTFGKYRHTSIPKEMTDDMFQPYAHTSLLNLCGIQIYAYSQTWHHKKTINTILRPYTHTSLLDLCGIQIYVHFQHYITRKNSTWHFGYIHILVF